MSNRRICSVDECGKPVHGHGWCLKHYKRWRKHGDPLFVAAFSPNAGLPLKFFEDALTYKGDDCLIWPFYRNPQGYAVFWHKGRARSVHRAACESRNGPPPKPKSEACHSCGNGHLGCVTGSHSYWGTKSENEMDKVRHNTSNRGERNRTAVLNEDQVRQIRQLIGSRTQADIAAMFGVSRYAIRAIKQGKTWRWLH